MRSCLCVRSVGIGFWVGMVCRCILRLSIGMRGYMCVSFVVMFLFKRLILICICVYIWGRSFFSVIFVVRFFEFKLVWISIIVFILGKGFLVVSFVNSVLLRRGFFWGMWLVVIRRVGFIFVRFVVRFLKLWNNCVCMLDDIRGWGSLSVLSVVISLFGRFICGGIWKFMIGWRIIICGSVSFVIWLLRMRRWWWWCCSCLWSWRWVWWRLLWNFWFRVVWFFSF